MTRATEKLKFNLTLLKNNCNFDRPNEFIRGYQEDSLERIPEQLDVLIYTKKGASEPPKWLTGIKDKLLPESVLSSFTPQSQSSGITVFIKVPDDNRDKSPLGYRIFAINYGMLGRFNLEKNVIQKNFGLYTATKILSGHGAHIKSSQSRVIQYPPVNKHIQYSSDEIELEGLTSFMETNENLSEISIQDVDSDDFSRMIGRVIGLNIQIKFQTADRPYLAHMATKLKRTLDYYNAVTKDDIKQLFKGIFPIDEDNFSLLTELNRKLITQLSSPTDRDKFCLFEPEIDFDMSEVDVIQIITDSREQRNSNLDLNDYFTLRPAPTMDELRSDIIKLLNGRGDSIKEWKIFEALYGELEHDGTTYILSKENWFEVPRDKFQRVNDLVDAITDTSYVVPDQVKQDSKTAITAAPSDRNGHKPKERIFNKTYCDSLRGEFFDESGKQIKIDGDKIEVCDIYIPERDGERQKFIHCKCNSGASSLSKLFDQGLVSAKSYTQFTTEYRNAANSHIDDPVNHIIENHRESIVQYLIINDKRKDKLTFFSKMVLEEVVRNLKSWGFTVKLCWVGGVYPHP